MSHTPPDALSSFISQFTATDSFVSPSAATSPDGPSSPSPPSQQSPTSAVTSATSAPAPATSSAPTTNGQSSTTSEGTISAASASASASPQSSTLPSSLSSSITATTTSASITSTAEGLSSTTLTPNTTTPTTLLTSTTSAPDTSTSSPAIAAGQQKHGSSGLSSPGLKAAVAIPVTLAGLALIFAFMFLLGRRRKRDHDEKKGEAEGRNRWTRHLRMFSFDAELLVGNNSHGSRSWLTRSRDPSVRSGEPSVRSHTSMSSVDHAAPMYRDALSDPRPDSRIAGAYGIIPASQLPRPDSQATAPPAYYGSSDRDGARSSVAVSAHSNPFRSGPPSPIEANNSPFADPPSSLSTDDALSARSTMAGSEAGSIREAHVARNVFGQAKRT